MAKTNRKTLKEYFGKGKKPDSAQFTDLIDSMLNIVDDGFNKSAERGLLLSPLNDEGAVMEVRRNILDGEPAWVISLGKNGELHIRQGEEEKPLLTLCRDGKIRMGDSGKVRLEVNGTICADSFTGGYMQGKVLADGHWQNIGELEYSCQAYHIVAACGWEGKGKYAVADVTAMNCFGQHPKIWSRRSWFGNRFNKIQFRWRNEGLKCGLQVRTRCNYGEDVWLHYRISSLLDMDFVTKRY